MSYTIILIVSIPLVLWLLKIENLKNNPIIYSYFLGAFTFIIVGSGYSVDGRNRFINAEIETFQYIIIVSSVAISVIIGELSRKKSSNEATLKSEVDRKTKYFWFILISIHIIFVLYSMINFNLLDYLLTLKSNQGSKYLVHGRTELFKTSGSILSFVFYNLSYLLVSLTIVIIKKRRLKLFFILYFAVCSVSLLHKTPIVLILLTVFYTNHLCGMKINLTKAIKWLIIALTFIYSFYIIFFPNRELLFYLSDLPQSIFHRIAGVYSEAIGYSIYNIEVKQMEYYLGATFPNPGGIFPHDPIYLPSVLHEQVMGYPGNLSIPAIGEIYSNFGFLSTIIFVCLLPFFISLIERYIFSLKINESIKKTLIVYICVLVVSLSQTSIFGSILELKNVMLIIAIILIFKIKVQDE